MQDQISSNVAWYEYVFKVFIGVISVLVGILWKKNDSRFTSLETTMILKADKKWIQEIDATQDNLKNDLTGHILDDAREHDKFVSKVDFHAYMEREIKPMVLGIATRVDESQREVKSRLDTLISQTADVIKRPEYKDDLGRLHQKIDTKQDKRGSQ
jgi:hypothetical protein